MLARAEAGLAQVKQRGGDLQLTCLPQDSQVWVDGVPQGSCQDFQSAGLTLGRRMSKVEVRREGYNPYQTYIEPDGTRARLVVTLAPSTSGGAP
jgi:hypothetical protein